MSSINKQFIYLMERREFFSILSRTTLGLYAERSHILTATKEFVSGKKQYTHRVQFGSWINDMRNQVLPRSNWPATTFDAVTEKDIVGCLKLGHQAGYNQIDVFGFFATSAYPVDIRSAFHDPERRQRMNRIARVAQENGIKIIYGLGVYSWGFDDIIKYDPAVQGPNKHVMCASAPESQEWQNRLVDAISAELPVDGFHLESADQGRCTCSKCVQMGDVEYHTLINIKSADYIRQKYPGKLVSCIIQGWSTWGNDFTDDDKGRLIDLSRHVDVIWDQGHRQTYVPAAKRKHFISQLHCDYGTSGGFWVYPPQRWDRLRWFFPYVYRTGEHIRELYDQGGRGVMYYQGPTINPGVEMNLLCGGRLLSDASRDIDEVLNEAVNELYGPKSSVAQAKLVEVFVKPEKAYFSVWQEAEIEKVEKAPPPGELYLAPLFGNSPGGPVYISEPFLDEKGRGTYRQALLASYDAVVANRGQFHDGDRIQRLGKCIMNAIADLDTLAMCKNK